MKDKQLLTSALNTAMMVAFAVPGGAPLGVASAVGLFFANFFPDPPVKPPDPPLTFGKLQAALDDLKADLLDGIWKSHTDHNVSRLLALHTGFVDQTWAGMQKLKMDGQRYVLDDSNKWITQWERDTDQYFDLLNTTGMLTELRGYRNDLTDSSLNDPSLTPLQIAERRTRTTGIYGLIGSLAAAYLKAAITWIWGQELLVAWQYQEYQKDVDHWKGQNAAYQAAHPLTSLQQKYPGLNTSANYVPPTWNDWLQEPGCPVPVLIQEVQTMLDYCVLVPANDDDGTPAQPGLYTSLRAHWDDFERQMASYDPPLVPNAGITIAQMKAALAQGALRAVAWDQVTTLYAIGHVTEDEIAAFGKTINAWKTVAATVNFRTVTVAAGDTLASLAQANYGDPALASQIFHTNGDQLSDATAPLPAGLVLKIFAADAFGSLAQGGF